MAVRLPGGSRVPPRRLHSWKCLRGEEMWKLKFSLVRGEIGGFLVAERLLRQSGLGKYAVDIEYSLPRLAGVRKPTSKGLRP